MRCGIIENASLTFARFLSLVVAVYGCTTLVPDTVSAAEKSVSSSASPAGQKLGNKPERQDWFQDQALGVLITWSVDAQLGTVIAHSMVGASDSYLDRYIDELPKTFKPENFNPAKWARLAKLSGIKYIAFITKSHSGFCMFDTKTTDFNIMHTPYGRDITRQVVDAFREQKIAVGFYFSPDDFWFLRQQGHDVSRRRPEAQPVNNPQLLAHNEAQIRELLTNYGPIDVMFLDGSSYRLPELCWELQPNVVVTRGAMKTPEQRLPGEPLPGPWEACFTMGTQWQYKPTNENYKSGTKLIEMLIETRAKGGNLLLSIGPDPDGVIPREQEGRLREMALWNFINGEAVFNIRPWNTTNEGDIWFTRAKNANTVYAIVTGKPWPHGRRRGEPFRKIITLKSVRATEKSEIEILGQSGNVLEYCPDVNPKATWKQDKDGLHITATRTQRLYCNFRWPNPVVIKITNAQPAPEEIQ